MIKLFHANIFRLFHSKVFKAGELFSIGYSLFALIAFYISNKNSFGADFEQQLKNGHLLDNMPLVLSPVFPIILAIVVGFFTGMEYSDGTIRNKLVAGHSRTSIYFAGMFTTYMASVIIFLTSPAIIYAIGIPIYGSTSLPFHEYAKAILVILVAGLACCSLYTFLCMAIQSKATGVVTVLILAMVMYVATMTITNRLNSPEYYDSYAYTNEQNSTITVEKVKNPHYLSGTKRKIYEKINNFLPYTHMLYLAQNVTLPQKPYDFPLNSGIIILASTACGIIIFKKKDLK